jgi:hypothetical protein
VTGSTANTRASTAGEDPAPSAILWSCTALMGTAAAVAARSDPGSVRARGRRAADQITPEPPEERRPPGGTVLATAICRQDDLRQHQAK